MKTPSYVLVTPVRNEEATIGITIESVIAQTNRPKEWIIVSDQSTDRTDEIVKQHAEKHPFIRLLRLEKRPKRSFASVVFVTETGIAALQTKDYEFIGLLDSDIRFKPDYYEQMFRRFSEDPKLGLAGGLVIDFYDGKYHRTKQSMQDVAGAVQLFRRECFELFGGLIALPEGGWDAITCLNTRMHGFKSRTFPEIEVDHLKPRNIAEGNLLRRNWQLGVREYAVGNHPLFELMKCVRRSLDKPPLIGSFMRFVGYTWCCLSGKKRMLSPEIVKFLRREQMSRLFRFGKSAASA